MLDIGLEWCIPKYLLHLINHHPEIVRTDTESYQNLDNLGQGVVCCEYLYATSLKIISQKSVKLTELIFSRGLIAEILLYIKETVEEYIVGRVLGVFVVEKVLSGHGDYYRLVISDVFLCGSASCHTFVEDEVVVLWKEIVKLVPVRQILYAGRYCYMFYCHSG